MSRGTSFTLGKYFDDFVSNLVSSGRYSSASEVVKAALRLLEAEEIKEEQLVAALVKGEMSGFLKRQEQVTPLVKSLSGVIKLPKSMTTRKSSKSI